MSNLPPDSLVKQAEVTYPVGTACILLDPDVAHLNQVIGLVEQVGYRIESQQGC